MNGFDGGLKGVTHPCVKPFQHTVIQSIIPRIIGVFPPEPTVVVMMRQCAEFTRFFALIHVNGKTVQKRRKKEPLGGLKAKT